MISSALNRFFYQWLICMMLLIFSVISTAQATCYRTSVTSTNSLFPNYVDTRYGHYQEWSARQGYVPPNMLRTNVSGLPRVVNITPFYTKPGEMLVSGVAQKTSYGWFGLNNQASWDPNLVLYVCDDADKNNIYEIYATAPFSGSGLSTQKDDTIEGGYKTTTPGVVFRLKHMDTNSYFSHTSQSRRLDYDNGPNGKIYIKVKHLSNTQYESFWVGSQGPTSGQTNTNPSGFSVFKGPGILDNVSLNATQDTLWANAGNNIISYILTYDVWYTLQPSCRFTTRDSVVVFPSITVEALKRGENRSAVVDLHYECITGPSSVSSGLDMGFVGLLAHPSYRGLIPTRWLPSIGLVPSESSYIAAVNAGLTDTNYRVSVSHLLSDNYGAPGYAKGVGIAFATKDIRRRLVRYDQLHSNWCDAAAGGGDVSACGWFPVGNGAQMGSQSNGMTQFTMPLTATLEAFDKNGVTPGLVSAVLRVVIEVQ